MTHVKLGPINYYAEKDYRAYPYLSKLHILANHYQLSEEFLEDFYNVIPIYTLNAIQTLPEKFMNKHRNIISWYYISQCQQLSEKFMRQNSKYLCWDLVAEYQKFSFRFAWLMRNHIDYGRLVFNRNISDQFTNRYFRMITNERESRVL